MIHKTYGKSGRIDGNVQIVEWAQARLGSSPYLALRSLICEFDQGVLTLRGQVPSYYLKQMALAELVRDLRGQSIENLVEVLPNDAGVDGGSLLAPSRTRLGRRLVG